MIKSIIKGPDPILTTVCEPFIFGQHNQVIEDLHDTLKAHGNARGLAAPQIGYSVKAFAANLKDQGLVIFLNPQIKVLSVETNWAEEACLSYPWLSGVKVERHNDGWLLWISDKGKH